MIISSEILLDVSCPVINIGIEFQFLMARNGFPIEVLLHYPFIGEFPSEFRCSGLAEDIEFVLEVSGVVAYVTDIGVVVEYVNPPSGKGDEGPKIEVDNAVGIHEKLCIRNVAVEEPVAVVFVLDFQCGDVFETAKQATRIDDLAGPPIEVFMREKMVCSWKIIAKSFFECREVSNLTLSVSTVLDV
jgi:hypothetical protein